MQSESTSSSPDSRQSYRLGRDISIATIVAALVSAVLIQLDLAERFHARTRALEGFEADEFPLVLATLGLAALFVGLRALRAARRETGRRNEVEARLEEAENRERLVLENVTTLVFEWVRTGESGRLRHMRAGQQGWVNVEHGLGHRISQQRSHMIATEDRSRIIKQLSDALLSGDDRFDIDYPEEGPEERWRHLEVVVVERTENGDPQRVIGVETDVTDRIELERERAAADAARTRSHVARGLVHDLGNLLIALDLYTQRLDPEDDAVSGIASVRERARELVTAFAELARDSPRPAAQVDIERIVAPTVAAFEATLPAGVRLSYAADPTLPRILGTAQAIERIVQNLLENARNAIERGGDIRVALTDVSGPPHLARITVTDTGRGMETHELERARQVFYTTKSASSGLGLAVVDHLVHELSGELRIESKLGQGTTVEIDIPAADSAFPSRGTRSPQATRPRPRP